MIAAVLRDYWELTKPRIIVLLLITTLAAMVMAQRGMPPLTLVWWTLLGGALAAASAGTFNCVYDRDIDAIMKRTMQRPLPQGRVSVGAALAFAIALAVAAFAVLYVFVNPLSAWLSLGGNAFYVFVYTIWLKRLTPLNIVIGGAAGAVPPLVGWAAVTNQIGAPALGLFALIFLWTPPHFWSLALITESDYGRARVPMLPNVRGIARTKKEILAYTIVLVALSIALFPLHVLGALYLGAASVLGALFIVQAVQTLRANELAAPRRLFGYSLAYLALMCLAMVADRVLA